MKISYGGAALMNDEDRITKLKLQSHASKKPA